MTPEPTVPYTTKKYYTIGEVAQLLNVPTHSIRFWEKKFPSLQPQKNERGVRRYTQTAIDQLKKICQLVKKQGYTLKGAKEAMKQGRASSQRNADLLHVLKNLRAFLVDLRETLEE